MARGKTQQSVLIVSSSIKIFDYFKALLPSSSFGPIAYAATAADAWRITLSQPYDIVIINCPLPDQQGKDLAIELTSQQPCAVMLMVKGDKYESIVYETEDYGILTLMKPCPRASIYQAVRLMASTSSRIRRSAKKVKILEDKIDELRIVNRAKLELISRMKVSEDEAHKYIEKIAMDMRITRRQVAEQLLKVWED